MEDLDAELLAVTDGQKRANRPSRGNASDSDGEFGGIADSDGGEDEDEEMLDDVEGLDDDDDDDEYGLDDDDEEFGTKGSRKKKASKQSKKKTPKSKSTKRRPRSSDKRSARGRDDMPLSDNEDDEFTYEFDQYGYGDAADQEKLARMNEVDRELILEERIEARNREYILWKKRREMMARSDPRERAGEKRSARSSGRAKLSSKSDALQALAEDKRKKSARVVDLDVSDADSEPDPSSRRQPGADADRKEKRRQSQPQPDESGPGLRYTDIVSKDTSEGRVTTPLFLRRGVLTKLSQEPFFHRAVVGLFCRVRALTRGDDSYLLCRIVDAEIGQSYEIGNGVMSNWSIVLQVGDQRRKFEILHTSGSAPSEAEFDKYCRKSRNEGVELPRREDIKKLLKRSEELIFNRKAVPTDAELKKHVVNMELLYPSRVNWTQKLTEAKSALDIKIQYLTDARERGDQDAVEKLKEEVKVTEKRVADVKKKEEKYVLKPVKTNAEVFHSLAKRNMALNNTTEKLVASRENLESRANGTNPFARFDTTGQSYFSIPSRDKKEPSKLEPSAPLNSYSDWRSLATTWDPSGKRRKVSETPLDPAYDTPLSSLHVFDGDGGGAGQGQGSGLLPAMVDAAYCGQAFTKSSIPSGAKILSLEEWSRQRAG